jgi:hypothetical protein
LTVLLSDVRFTLRQKYVFFDASSAEGADHA